MPHGPPHNGGPPPGVGPPPGIMPPIPPDVPAPLPFRPDIDAFVTEQNESNQVLINQGGAQGGIAGELNLGIPPEDGGIQNSLYVALGDLDGDGDLDAFVVNNLQPNQVVLNDGSGTFTLAPNQPEDAGFNESFHVALGDLDGDGDLDAVVANRLQPTQVLINQGLNSGDLNLAAAALQPNDGSLDSREVALGDLDGDGDLDAFVANFGGTNHVLINQAMNSGNLKLGIQQPDGGIAASTAVALGDLDGDGDLDAFVANFGGTNHVLINQALNSGDLDLGILPADGGFQNSVDVALGDLDGDGDLDAFVVNQNQPNQVVLNDGSGTFTLAPDQPEDGGFLFNSEIALGDLDGDGDLDAVVTSAGEPNLVLINQGGAQGGIAGDFNLGIPPDDDGGFQNSSAVALGDLDGDGNVPPVDDDGLPNLDPSGLLLA